MTIVDNAVAADPLVICRLAVKMDARVKSGDNAFVPTNVDVEARFHDRLALIGR